MNKKAFTLIEIVIATLIIAILAAGMLSSYMGSNYIFKRTTHRIQAFNFAKEAYDRLRADYQYTDSQMDAVDGHLESEIGVILKGEMLSVNEATLTYDVSEPESGAYKAVTIHVNWEEAVF